MSNFIRDQRYDDLLTELSEPAISQRISPVSADILPDHILEGKHRRPNRRAVFFTQATRDPYVV
jgi:hypothetical protein